MTLATTKDLRLLQAGVGIISSSQSPQFVTNEYLKAKEIVPSSWELSNSQASPQVFQSQIFYGNGVMFLQNGGLLRIVEKLQLEFSGKLRCLRFGKQLFWKRPMET